jgi:uncharacterized protein YktB (UPF0637 family)
MVHLQVQRLGLHEQYLTIMQTLITRVEQSQSRAQEMEKAAQHLLKGELVGMKL